MPIVDIKNSNSWYQQFGIHVNSACHSLATKCKLSEQRFIKFLKILLKFWFHSLELLVCKCTPYVRLATPLTVGWWQG